MKNTISSVISLSHNPGFNFSEDDASEHVANFARILWEGYRSLQVGNFIVIGVPPSKLRRFTYDCQSYGVPTGKNVWEVVREPEKCPRLTGMTGGHQVRLLMHEETLDPASGIQMVTANDTEQVNAFCADLDITPPEELPIFDNLFTYRETETEKEEREKAQALDQKLQAMIRALVYEAAHYP